MLLKDVDVLAGAALVVALSLVLLISRNSRLIFAIEREGIAATRSSVRSLLHAPSASFSSAVHSPDLYALLL